MKRRECGGKSKGWTAGVVVVVALVGDGVDDDISLRERLPSETGEFSSVIAGVGWCFWLSMLFLSQCGSSGVCCQWIVSSTDELRVVFLVEYVVSFSVWLVGFMLSMVVL